MKIQLGTEHIEAIKLLGYNQAGKLLFALLYKIAGEEHELDDILVEMAYAFCVNESSGILVE